jgi:hypothetical protein
LADICEFKLECEIKGQRENTLVLETGVSAGLSDWDLLFEDCSPLFSGRGLVDELEFKVVEFVFLIFLRSSM